MSRTDVLDDGAKKTPSRHDGGSFMQTPGETTHDDHLLGGVVPRPSARASHRPCLSCPCIMRLPASVAVVGRFEQGLRVLRAPKVTLREGFEVVAPLADGLEAVAHGSPLPGSGGWYCLAMRLSRSV